MPVEVTKITTKTAVPVKKMGRDSPLFKINELESAN